MTMPDPRPVSARVVLLEPGTHTVVWTNDPSFPGAAYTLDQAVPLHEQLGLSAALGRVESTGGPVHLSTGLVSTRRGTVTVVASVYRLPDGTLLVATENSWHHDTERRDQDGAGRATRRRR